MSDPVPVVVPQHNPNDDSAVLVRWHTACGEWVASGQLIATLETTKATFDLQAVQDGYLFHEIAPPATVTVGGTIGWLSENASRPERPVSQSMPLDSRRGTRERFTRKALQLARQHHLLESDFDAALARIEVEDVERLVNARSAGGVARPLAQTPSKMAEVTALSRACEGVIPSAVTLSLSVDKSAARLQRLAREHGPVSLLEVVIFEVGRLLEGFEDLNGYYGEGCAHTYRSANIGFAINLGHSLRVPVVRNTPGLALVEVARTVRDLSLRYMREELALEDLTGGTFTITDLSGWEAVHFIPVLNLRQSAMLGICSARPGTGTRDIVLAFDHRMSDGMRAASFLTALRERLESNEAD